MFSLCRWGMHLPGPRKVFHRGHLFTRCAECDTTLIARARGWAPIPSGKRVIWRARTPTDRLFAISTNNERRRLRFDLATALRSARPIRADTSRPPEPPLSASARRS